MRRYLPKASGVMGGLFVVAVAICVNAWADPQQQTSKRRSEERARPSAVVVADERDFGSFEELFDYFQDNVDLSGDHGIELGRLRSDMGAKSHGCVCPIASPQSIVVAPPAFIKLIQLNFNTSFGLCGSCGLTVCARLAYDLVFASAPPTGAFLFGPIPGASTGQVCVGETDSAKAFLILTRQIPRGTYLIRFEATGAGDTGIATVFVTVQ